MSQLINSNSNRQQQVWRQQVDELFGDMRSNSKYKQSYNKVMQFMQLVYAQYQWCNGQNNQLSKTNLQNNHMGLKQIINKLSIKQGYDQQRVLITKAYITNKSPNYQYQQQNKLSLNPNTIITEQVLLVHYANRLHLIKHNHKQNNQFVLQKSHIVTSPLLQTVQNTHITIQPYSIYTNTQYHYKSSTHNNIIPLQRLNYQSLLTQFISITKQKSYQQLIQFKSAFYKDDAEHMNKINTIHYRLKQVVNQLLASWHQKQAIYRVALITQHNQFNNNNKQHNNNIPNIYIYQPFQAFYSLKTSPLFNITLINNIYFTDKTASSSFANLILSIRLVKQLLLYQLISTKHSQAINQFNIFKTKLQSQFYQQLKHKQQQNQLLRQQKLQLIKNTSSLKNYQNLQIKNLFIKWNNNIKNQSTNKTPYISLSLNSMYLVNQYKYIRMKCQLFISYTDRKNKQYKSTIQTRYFAFLFDEITDDWNVKLVPQQNQSINKNIFFELSKVTDYFNLMVKITPQNNNTTIINGFCTISKRQKMHGFGDNQQLVLYQEDNKSGNQRIVGFLKLFYLVKDYYDTSKAKSFDLLKYRKIKVLQTMPYLPANYFQHTFINYNPNDIRLFSQLTGHQLNSISRQNYQKVYLKLVEFLESERMDQRRENMIIIGESNRQREGSSRITGIEGKQRRFMPYQRMSEYENIMRIKLARQIINSYNGIHNTHWIDKSNKITRSQLNSQRQKLQDNDLIGEFLYTQINSDQLSMKTSLIVNQALKQSMYQSQVLFVRNAHIQTMGVMSTIFSLNQNSVSQYRGSIYRTINDGRQQLRRVKVQQLRSNIFPSLHTFNPYMVPLINRLITLYKHHQLQQQSQVKSTSLQKQTSIISSTYHQPIDQSRVVQFIVNFLNSIYPYSQPKALQRQLMYIRYFITKYLPQVSYQLNRKNIGLQNFVTKYILSLFTMDLQQQVTFQIWDFIILSTNKFAARLNVMLTLIIFMQKTNFSPIIPLDTFVNALKQNHNKFDFSYNAKKVSQLMISSLGQFYQKQHTRKIQLSKLRDTNNRLLIGDQFIKKVLFDTDRENKISYQKNKVNLNQLVYKLPQPKYYGHPIQQIQLLIRNFCILQTVLVNGWTLCIKWHNQSYSIKINQKSQLINSYVRFQYPKYLLQNLHDLPPLQFVISPGSQKQQKRYFIGCLSIMGLHKDSVYCQEVKLVYIKGDQMIESNKGENVINVQFILKSYHNNSIKRDILENNNRLTNSRMSNIMNKSRISMNTNNNSINLGLQRQYHTLTKQRQQQIYSSLLDYDISSTTNTTIKSISQLKKQLIRMKNPIDQFNKQSYQHVKITSIGDSTFPQVIMNSQLLIQQLQSLIQTFNNQKLRTSLPILYKLYSQQTNYQMVFLTQILIQAILIDNTINLQTKIQYLYLIGKHYQNSNSKGLTSQTVDYIFYYVYKTYGWLNPIPYTKQNKGGVLKGVIYTNGVKNNDDALDITSILQDYAHMNKIKHNQYSLPLGSQQFLTQLQSLLPLQTLQTLDNNSSNNNKIKIQITYLKNNSQYLYTVNVNVSDFRIIQEQHKQKSFSSTRNNNKKQLNGGKVMVHGKYCANKNKLFPNNNESRKCQQSSQCFQRQIQLDTSSEILYNCSNIISLQSPFTFDRTAFRKAIYTTPMLSYLLNYSSLFQPVDNKLNKKMIIPKSPLINNQQYELKQYRDWVLYRYQYCQQYWRRCKLQTIQDDIAYVKLLHSQLKIQQNIIQLLSTKYNINISPNILCRSPQFEVWSMQQNLIKNNNQQQQTQQTQNNIQKRKYKKQFMAKISQKYNTTNRR